MATQIVNSTYSAADLLAGFGPCRCMGACVKEQQECHCLTILSVATIDMCANHAMAHMANSVRIIPRSTMGKKIPDELSLRVLGARATR
jgi:hypothetical protein